MVKEISILNSISNLEIKKEETSTSYYSSCILWLKDHFEKLEFDIENIPLKEKLQQYFLDSALKIEEFIKCKREEMKALKDEWRGFIEIEKSGEKKAFYAEVDHVLFEGGYVQPLEGGGAASTYFLFDKENQARFVIKPVDEEILCFNNRNQFFSLDEDSRVRKFIPLYRSAQTDYAVSEIARIIGISRATPQAGMIVFSSNQFFDFTDQKMFTDNDRECLAEMLGPSDKEKLCSIQEFIPNAKNLGDLLLIWQSVDLSDEEIANRIDQEDFEIVNFLMQITGETDGHSYNILACPKSIDASGNVIWGLKKVDNALALPEKNAEYMNFLSFLPNANKPYSEKIKTLIASLPMDKIEKKLIDLQLSKAFPSLKQRVELVQTLSAEGKTISEINFAMQGLNHE